jgi:isoquinoline 1-oxidoreductase beta subunit
MAGAIGLPYRWPNALLEWKMCNTFIPTSAWRSVASSQGTFATEGFLDEVAAEVGRDPLEFRLALLDDERLRACLERAAEGIGWGRSLPAGRGLGIACYQGFGSRIAQAVEAEVSPDGAIKVHRVECAIDCGWAVNPDAVAAQCEGGTVFALTAAVHGEITVEQGQVQQLTYAEYPLMTMEEAPVVNTHIIEGGPPLGGIGEPPVPAAAPALANAIYAACGRRLRRMPFRRVDMSAD